VINKGLPPGQNPPSGSESLPCGSGGGIAEFSVGGQGVLAFQQCFQAQGNYPVWAAKDSTGTYLYVLTQQSPALSNGTVLSGGAITVFTIAPDTGRLSLVVNQQVKDPGNQAQLTFFPVGTTTAGSVPTMLAVAGGSCVFTLNTGVTPATVTPYAIGTAGQLTQTTNSDITINNAARPTSIVAGGSNIYITDAGVANSSGQIPAGQLLPFTVSTSTACTLSTVTGGAVQNISGTANPVYTLVDSTSKYLYIINQSSTNSTVPNSSISGFNIQTAPYQQIPDGTNNPYAIGAGPVCMVEDPSNQYLYTSNGDGTVTGKILDRNTGRLSNLTRGSTFTAVGQASCLAVSGNVD
jgi:hypothetical protein